jgi:long-subunit acyl-CoA synthetase (AMP-forming)
MNPPFHDTIPRQFLASVQGFGKPDAFRLKRDGRYIDVAHTWMLEQVHAAACALRALGLARGDRVALLSEIASSGRWPTSPCSRRAT